MENRNGLCVPLGLDERTTRRESYRIRQRKRKRIEEIFGWLRPTAAFARRASSARLALYCTCIWPARRTTRLYEPTAIEQPITHRSGCKRSRYFDSTDPAGKTHGPRSTRTADIGASILIGKRRFPSPY